MQLDFKFSSSNEYQKENFIVFEGNKNIYNFLDKFENNIILITGPEKSGKTFLCNILKTERNATFINKKLFKKDSDIINIKDNFYYILEDIEKLKIDEKKLLFLINIIIEKNSKLVITSTKHLYEFEFNLEDLKSRFLNIINFEIQDPNDNTKKLLLIKLLSDKQIKIDNNSLEYLVKNIENNYKNIFNAVEKISKSLEEKKNKEKITIPFLKNLFKF